MGTSFYLPKKADYEVQYSLTTAKSWNWTAPKAAGEGVGYQIEIKLYGSGSGSEDGIYNTRGGRSGSSGSFTVARINVVPGTAYTINVPSGGARASNGSGAYISDGSGSIITAGGGIYLSSGGSVSVGQPSKVVSHSDISGKAYTNAGMNGEACPGGYGEPGGAGGMVGAYNGGDYWIAGAGSPGSPHTTGSNGGDNSSQQFNTGSGAGAPGYFQGAAGNPGGSGSSPNSGLGVAGGGGAAFIRFTVLGNGSLNTGAPS